MKNYRLTIITENQNHLHKAQKVAELIRASLNIQADPEITKYEKFENSYKIKFVGTFDSDSNFIAEAIQLTNKLASPWLVQYDRTTGDIELLFTNTINCRYRRQEFNIISWANLETE